MKATRTCSVCDRKHFACGLCQRHYSAAWIKTHAYLPCSVDGCEKTQQARGWCSMHYRRWLRSVGGSTVARPLAERFWEKVDKRGPGECWPWTGSTSGGYGSIWDNEIRAKARAHRVSYELNVGPIPDGLTIDHVWARGCRRIDCVNPAHLEPVTKAENTARERAVRNQRSHT